MLPKSVRKRKWGDEWFDLTATAEDEDSCSASAAQSAKRQRQDDEQKHEEKAASAAFSGASGAVHQPPAQTAAAAWAAPSAASANLNERSAAAASSATTAAIPLSDAPECPVCVEAYDCEESMEADESRIPRTLPCAHSACSGCLLKQLALTPGSVSPHSQPAASQTQLAAVER
jgi:hypothetical protein